MKKIFIKKVLSASFIALLSIQMVYVFFEPRVAQAVSVTDNVIVTLTVDAGITITAPGDVTMSTLGITVDRATGSALWNVKTNNTLGYDLFLKASTTPALRRATLDTFNDYTPVGGVTVPDAWGGVAAGDKEFGFSTYGANVSTTTWGTAQNCGSGATIDPAQKYTGFTTSNSIATATQNTPTTTAGVDTTVCFAAQQNGVFAVSGVYTATITATATTK